MNFGEEIVQFCRTVVEKIEVEDFCRRRNRKSILNVVEFFVEKQKQQKSVNCGTNLGKF